jgi:hypothetical protein
MMASAMFAWATAGKLRFEADEYILAADRFKRALQFDYPVQDSRTISIEAIGGSQARVPVRPAAMTAPSTARRLFAGVLDSRDLKRWLDHRRDRLSNTAPSSPAAGHAKMLTKHNPAYLLYWYEYILLHALRCLYV